jgi:hypothetical protein
MTRYRAFCLNFQSDIPLPELIPGGLVPDVIIRHEYLGAMPADEGPIKCLRADDNMALLSWGKVGLVCIRAGNEILVDPAPNAHSDAVRLFILGAALGVLLHQRGNIVLHASAVLINGRVVAFIGDKGSGKSSTAACLVQRGHPLVTDDLLVMQCDSSGQPVVFPGYTQLKLWPDTAEALGIDTDNLPKIRPDVEKRIYTPSNSKTVEVYPLGCIYVLGAGHELMRISLPAQAALFSLLRNMYISRFGNEFQQPGTASSLFLQAADLIKHIPVYGLVRPIGLPALTAIAQLVEENV